MGDSENQNQQQDGSISNDIQDYLNLLLSPTAESEKSGVDSSLPEKSEVVADTGSQHAVKPSPKHSKPVIEKLKYKSESPGSGLAVNKSYDTENSGGDEAISPVFEANKPVNFTAPSERSGQQERRHRPKPPQTSRPFAEPEKPLPLKMALPKLQAKAAAQETQPETADKNDAQSGDASKSRPEIQLKATGNVSDKEDISKSDESITKTQSHPTSVWHSNGKPTWAQERFECLLFSAGGLTLAVPLKELGTIYPLSHEDELTPLFGQVHWFMGLLTIKGNNIRTVNTAKVVMPERYEEVMASNFNYVITINGVDWGLAVDNVANAITLEPEDVRWRSKRSKRPWLAGTVVDHMCALLDVSQLANMFLDEDRSGH